MSRDLEFEFSSYRLIQSGLQALLAELMKWNQLAREQGATETPYEKEIRKLRRMIEYGLELLSKEDRYWVSINGVSEESLGLLRAGLELVIRQRRETVKQNRAEGVPERVSRSVEESISKLEELAAQALPVEPAEILWTVIPQGQSAEIVKQMRSIGADEQWDAFISHAWQDKDDFVRPLVEKLTKQGLSIWYDEFTLRVGDSLRAAIDRGLSQSRFGVVVLSPYFMAKEWPQRELDGLLSRESDGHRLILPVWRDISAEMVKAYSPTLAGIVAVKSSEGLDRVASKLIEALRPE